jgi:hypothetical protein
MNLRSSSIKISVTWAIGIRDMRIVDEGILIRGSNFAERKQFEIQQEGWRRNV